MENIEQRNVFNANMVLDRKAVITAVAIDQEQGGCRAFLGLEDGMLEEYSLENIDSNPFLSLTARKPIVLKQPILSIHPATTATCLAVLTADAALRFVHSDTLESKIIHKGPILAVSVLMAPPSSTTNLPQIVVATKINMGRAIRLTVYEIVPAGGQVPGWRHLWDVDVSATLSSSSSSSGLSDRKTPNVPNITSTTNTLGPVHLGWAGSSVVVSFGLHYMLAWAPSSLSARNNSKQIVNPSNKGHWRDLFSFDDSGSQQPYPSIVSLPRENRALLVVGPVAMVINSSGEPIGNPIPLEGLPTIRAMASGEAGMVAFVSEEGMLVANPESGQWVQGLPYGDRHRPRPGQPLRAAGGGTATSTVVLVGGRHKVWALTPVPPSEQVRDLLSRRDFKAAEKLAAKGLLAQQTWAEEAYAQAALLLMEENRFIEAMSMLEYCSPAVFQPAELFPLFPQYVFPTWESTYPSHAMHWNLTAAPLESIEVLIIRNNNSGVRVSGPGDSFEMSLATAKRCIIQYLFRARMLPGIELLDGIDTLLMHLFMDIHARDEASAFSSMPNKVVVDLVADRLRDLGWLHTLASLYAMNSNAESALHLWKQVVTDSEDQKHQNEGPMDRRDKDEALDGATQLLLLDIVPAALVSRYIPWLLSTSPCHAVHVLTSRHDLSPSEILPLLPRGGESRWRYLLNQVESDNEQNDYQNKEFVHTELALSLIAALGRLHTVSDKTGSSEHKKPLNIALNASQTAREVLVRKENLFTNATTVSPQKGSMASLITGAADDTTNAHLELRTILRNHLEQSQYIAFNDTLIQALSDPIFKGETAIVYWRMARHTEALYTLAIEMQNITAAVSYASAFLDSDEHRILLDLLLHPSSRSTLENSGDVVKALEPRWDDACRVVALLGESLDPLEVVRAAPESMPLSAAIPLLSPLIRERLHRRRRCQMTAALQRSRATSGMARKVDAEQDQVVIDDGRACPDCHLRLGGKVFVVDRPSMSVLCLNCWKKRQSQ